ncbi:hypothetical protein PoB_005964700 [Plakobranchus ocellatus]|uniref:Uncharacterized protein n=1 Tax=Plakobranchus ocellatus TaxID=259542 RepID=A0AAV4CMU3_9GAST|nr:hypothetical protein PoB_005964700 [Plakobranchus ocellatus]
MEVAADLTCFRPQKLELFPTYCWTRELLPPRWAQIDCDINPSCRLLKVASPPVCAYANCDISPFVGYYTGAPTLEVVVHVFSAEILSETTQLRDKPPRPADHTT